VDTLRPCSRLLIALGVGLLLLTAACGGAAPAGPAAPAPATQSTAAPAGRAGGECAVLTAADVTAVTGAAVTAVARGAFAGAGGTCGNYATAAGEGYLGVNRLTSAAEYSASIDAVPADVYPVRERLTGLGDEAVLFKDRAVRPYIRYLVARQGAGGVVIFPHTDAISDDALKQLAAKALSVR
jgi:hypothetical protein